MREDARLSVFVFRKIARLASADRKSELWKFDAATGGDFHMLVFYRT